MLPRAALTVLLLLAVAALPAAANHVPRVDHRIVEPYGVEVLRHLPVVQGYEPFPPPQHCLPGVAPASALYREDFEGESGFTFAPTPLAVPHPTRGTPNLWKATTFAGLGGPSPAGPMHLYFGFVENGTYDTNLHVAGSAVSPPVALPPQGHLWLSFATKWQVEWLKGYDHLWVEAQDAQGRVHLLCSANSLDRADPSGVNGETLVPSCSPRLLGPCPDAPPEWERRMVLLPDSLMGQVVRVQFTFDSADGKANIYLGWMLDDVRIGALADA